MSRKIIVNAGCGAGFWSAQAEAAARLPWSKAKRAWKAAVCLLKSVLPDSMASIKTAFMIARASVWRPCAAKVSARPK
jgi:hypothetical protein